jgi:hypothetical protein
MNGVGTDQGYVHRQRQGTGKATVLTGGNTDDYFAKYSMLMGAERQKKLAEREATKSAALKKLNDYNPDFFYKHKDEIAKAQNEMKDLALAAMKGGALDPYTSTDPASVAFQRKYEEVDRMSKVSTQVKDQYKAYQQDIQGKGADHFDVSTIGEADGYFFGRSLGDHLTNPTGQPLVRQRKPYQNTVDQASAVAAKINGSLNGNPYDPAKGREVIRAMFVDPETGKQTAEAHVQALAALSEGERKEIEKQAQNFGISPPEMLAVRNAEAFITSPKPFEVEESLKRGLANFDVSTSTYGDHKGRGTSVKEKTTMQSAMKAAYSELRSDPRALNEWARFFNLKQDANETETEFFAEVQRAAAKHMYDLKDKDTGYVASNEGGKEKEVEVSSDLWLQDLKSGKYELAQEAAGVIRGLKFLGNLEVSDATVVASTGTAGPLSGKPRLDQGADRLAIKLKTPMATRLTEEEVATQIGVPAGEGKFELQQGQGETTVILKLDKLEPNDNMFKSMYKQSVKEGASLYKGAGYTRAGATVDDLLPGATPPSAPATTKPAVFNY